MKLFQNTYLKISGNQARVDVDFYYLTGSDVSPDDYAKDSTQRVKTEVESRLSGSVCTYHFAAAPEIWEEVQKRAPKDKMLNWASTPMETIGGYVGLVTLHKFYEFLQDQPQVLAERIFESNVRGYQGASTVNTEIKQSLENSENGVNFWLLNNGITIIATNTTRAGYPYLNIQDPQIVNGLQTSREIFNYCNSADRSNDLRCVLIRVVRITDSAIQDLVIKATNSQNQMAQSALRMTDQIHRDIEHLLTTYDLYYDRRKGYYKDLGRPITKIVSVNLMAQAMVAIVLQRPDDARARPGDYFKTDTRYRAIFDSPSITLPVYVKCILLMRRIEKYLSDKGVRAADAKNIKFHMATDLTCELTRVSRPWPAKLLDMPDVATLEDSAIDASFGRVQRIYDELAAAGTDRDAIARGPDFLRALLSDIRRRFPSIRRRLQLAGL